MKWAVLEGDRDLLARLDELKKSHQRRVMRPAINKGLTPILRAAKAKCPRESGALKKALGRKVAVRRRGGEVVGMVGVRKGKQFTVIHEGQKRVPSNYAHLVEFGHGGSKRSAPAPAHPFLRPALDENREEALRIVAQSAGENLDRLAKKMKARGQ